MKARAIDHVNLTIPEDRVDDAVDFYHDRLGFGIEDLEAYRSGDRPLFSIRLGESCIIHFSPTDEFVEPTGQNFSHVCIVLEADIEEIRSTAEDASINIRRESTPLGATGRNDAIYVDDPFGYILELKAAQ